MTANRRDELAPATIARINAGLRTWNARNLRAWDSPGPLAVVIDAREVTAPVAELEAGRTEGERP